MDEKDTQGQRLKRTSDYLNTWQVAYGVIEDAELEFDSQFDLNSEQHPEFLRLKLAEVQKRGWIRMSVVPSRESGMHIE